MDGRSNGFRPPPYSSFAPRPPTLDAFDPFAGFPFGGSGLFGAAAGGSLFPGMPAPGSLFSSVFGGRDPFDDPFFRGSPFGSLTGPSLFGGPMGPPGFFGGSLMPFGERGDGAGGFGRPAALPERRRGPVITELDENGEELKEGDEERKGNGRKHARANMEPHVEDPDVDEDIVEEKKSKNVQFETAFSTAGPSRVQPRTYTFQSSTVSFGGSNGAYYTSSKTRRTGGDGVTVEESKEADSNTGRAQHSVSRKLREKGHTITRNLASDGRVDTTQMLHNLNEDELPEFDQSWNGEARQHLPGWNPQALMVDNGHAHGGRPEPQQQARLLPAPDQPGYSRARNSSRNSSSRGRAR